MSTLASESLGDWIFGTTLICKTFLRGKNIFGTTENCKKIRSGPIILVSIKKLKNSFYRFKVFLLTIDSFSKDGWYLSYFHWFAKIEGDGGERLLLGGAQRLEITIGALVRPELLFSDA